MPQAEQLNGFVNETGDEYWYKLLKVSPDGKKEKEILFRKNMLNGLTNAQSIVAHSNPF